MLPSFRPGRFRSWLLQLHLHLSSGTAGTSVSTISAVSGIVGAAPPVSACTSGASAAAVSASTSGTAPFRGDNAIAHGGVGIQQKDSERSASSSTSGASSAAASAATTATAAAPFIGVAGACGSKRIEVETLDVAVGAG